MNHVGLSAVSGTGTDVPVVKPYGWYVGIPICTNPVIALDVFTVSVILWAGGTLFVMLGQATIGGGLTRQTSVAACVIALYLALAVLAAYLVVGGILLGNRYAALYRIDSHGVYCEYIRGDLHPLDKVFLPVSGYAIDPVRSPRHTVEKHFAWENIRSVERMDRMKILVLKGKRGTLTKIYCPNITVLATAEAILWEVLSKRTV